MSDLESGRPAGAQPAGWWRRAAFPRATLAVFSTLAVVLWVDLAVNTYRFNLAEAVLGSIPPVILTTRGIIIARRHP